MKQRAAAAPRLGCAALLATFLLLPSAHAALVSGSFTGAARGAFDGAAAGDRAQASALTGTFRVNIPTEPWWDNPHVAPPFGEITFHLGGETFRFLAGPDLPDSPGAISIGWAPQSITFSTSFQPRFDGAMLTFSSADGAMFRDGDFSTLAIDQRTVSGMTASFASSRAGLSMAVDIHAFRFDVPASPVDEPAAPLLGLAGMAIVGGMRRGRRRQAA